MPDRTQVELGGRSFDAETVHVNSSNENWNVYLLEDGTTLRLKTVLVSVARLNGAFDADGNPVYVTKTQNVAVADAPERLRRQA